MTAGPHTLKFVGLDSAGGDNTVFLDQVAVEPVASSISLDTGVGADGSAYDGGYISVPEAVQSDSQLDSYLADHPVASAPAFDAGFQPVPAYYYAWLADGPSSNWIGPDAAGQAGAALAPFVAGNFTADSSAPQGLFYYTTQFVVPAGAAPQLVGGRWATDNQALGIFLNGVAQPLGGASGFKSFTDFALDPDDFRVGLNTLTFAMFNEEYGGVHDSPTGLRVEGTIAMAAPATPAVALSALSGHVYDDANDDGRMEPGEPGVGGVAVRLTGTTDAGAAVGAATTTGADGSYSFPGLVAGTYSLTEAHPAASPDGRATPGSLGGTAVPGQLIGIRVGSTGGTGYDFGLDRPPTFTTAAPTQVQAGNTYVYQPSATDPDGDTLHYTLLAGPATATFDAATGRISWPTTAADLGAQAVALRVDDGRGGTAEQDVTVQVVDVPDRPPIFTSTPVIDAYVGESYNYQAAAFDPDLDPLTFSPAATLPTGMAFSPTASGLIGWTPTPDELGAHPVTIQVSDGRGGTATQSYTVVVHLPKGYLPPVFVSQPVSLFREPNPIAATTVLATTIRDFEFDGVNFEGQEPPDPHVTTGIVGPLLGPDGTPVYTGIPEVGGCRAPRRSRRSITTCRD